MAPALNIKLEVVLNDTSLKYYPGDQVEGMIFITSNRNHRLSNLRLAWTGRISVQPIQNNKDFRIYFNECWKLGPMISKSSKKTSKGSSQVTYYHTHLIPMLEDAKEPKIELPKNKTIGFTFKVSLPNDRPLPSSTEKSALNNIIYLLEAFIDHQESKPVFFGQRVVPVYGLIYTGTPEMMQPQRVEQLFMVSLSQLQREFTSIMSVTLPCRGCQPGIVIPVSIKIWNNMEFSRKQGISISLIRVNHVTANGRNYTSPSENVHRVVADLNITSENRDQNNQKLQIVRVGLPIHRGTTPTITLEQSQLLSVSYYIRVQVYAQEGVYTTTEGVKSKFMIIDIPFTIGTLSTGTSTPTSPRTSVMNSPMTTPISSPKTTTMSSSLLRNTSTNSSNKTPILSPRLNNSLLASAYVTPKASSSTSTESSSTIKQNNNNNNNNNNSITTTPIGSPEISKSINETKRIISGMFRKSSSGSSTEEGKKKNMFSTLRLYGRNKEEVSPAAIMTRTEQTKKADDDNDDDKEEKETNNQAIVETTNQRPRVFDIFGDDNLSDREEVVNVVKQEKVFKMFPDDSDEEEEEEEVKKDNLKEEVNDKVNTGVFKMFPDSDDESDDDDDMIGNTEQNEKEDHHGDDENTTTTTKLAGSDLKLLSTHVFRLFEDSDSDEEEENEINQLSISTQDMTCIDERVKPYEQHKNTIY